MKVFLTWSGPMSGQVATALREWLPLVLQFVQPYMSAEDVGKGVKWFPEISEELAASKYGIVCMTPENVDAPWLNFEAGALGKTLEESRVSPFLLGLSPSDLEGPLTQFQGTRFDKDDVKRLVHSINQAAEEKAILPTVLDQSFEMFWPKLNRKLSAIEQAIGTSGAPSRPQRDEGEVLEELVELVRSQNRQLSAIGTSMGRLPPPVTAWKGKVRSRAVGQAIPSDERADELIDAVIAFLGEDGVNRVGIDEGRIDVLLTRDIAPGELPALKEMARPYGLRVVVEQV